MSLQEGHEDQEEAEELEGWVEKAPSCRLIHRISIRAASVVGDAAGTAWSDPHVNQVSVIEFETKTTTCDHAA